MYLRAGGPISVSSNRVGAAPVTEQQRNRIVELPTNFDWRNVNGENYVTSVRDQEHCGSCYAFASVASLEARLLIATEGARKETFSPQVRN